MKRCVSTQTWQPVTANLTLPFGTVSWLHFSSKPWRGSAFTSFLQLFFVARSTMMMVAPQGGLSSSFTSRLWLDNGKLLHGTLHGSCFVAEFSIPIDFCPFWFRFWTRYPLIVYYFVPMDLDLQNEELDQHLVGLCDWFTFITNIPSLVVKQQKIVHFGYGLLFTERC